MCNDWHTAVLPCYLKTLYKPHGIYKNAKVSSLNKRNPTQLGSELVNGLDAGCDPIARLLSAFTISPTRVDLLSPTSRNSVSQTALRAHSISSMGT